MSRDFYGEPRHSILRAGLLVTVRPHPLGGLMAEGEDGRPPSRFLPEDGALDPELLAAHRWLSLYHPGRRFLLIECRPSRGRETKFCCVVHGVVEYFCEMCDAVKTDSQQEPKP